MRIMPGQPVPSLSLPLAGGGTFTLGEKAPASFTLLVVYRGLHCPICKGYLNTLQDKLADLEALGITTVAVSSDDQDRAERAKADWKLDRLAIAYGMSIEEGRSWGLYVSKAISDKEPPYFLEPGLFLVQPDGTLYCASIQTMPFTRPDLEGIIGAVRFINDKGYPARGAA